MLGEFTGLLQLVTCVFICIATCIWLKILRHVNKTMFETKYELLKAETRISSLEVRLTMLMRLASTNHQIEQVNQSLADLHAKE